MTRSFTISGAALTPTYPDKGRGGLGAEIGATRAQDRRSALLLSGPGATLTPSLAPVLNKRQESEVEAPAPPKPLPGQDGLGGDTDSAPARIPPSCRSVG